MQKKAFLGILSGLVLITLFTSFAQGAETMIADGKKVKIDYTLTVDGEVVDSSQGKEPLEYTQGQGMLISGLEKELEGMQAGDEKKVTVAPAEGYGEVSQDAFREIPVSQFPQNITPEAGQRLSMQTPQGQQIPVTVAEVKDDVIVLNFNHPLAGKELTFDVKVVSVD
jgi:peptidylprolyl isomerase